MRYTPLNLLGGSNVDDNVDWSCEDTINYIIQNASSDGALTKREFRDAPGLKPYVMGPTGAGPVRGSHDCEGKHFVVMGSTFYQVTNAGIAIPLGTVPGTQRVNISHNQIVGGNQVIVTTGTPNGYVYNTVTLVFGRITDPGYPGGGSVDYIDTYLVSVEPFGRYWFWSDQANATSYNTLNRTEAESDPDSIVGLAVNSFEVVVFGQNTVEFFYNAGGINGSTFRSKKVMNNHGCAARDSIVKLDNSIFWLGVDGILYRLNGYQAQPISSPQFTQRIAGLNWSKAFAFAYEDQGHVMYCITFPDGNTFCYDVTTGLIVRRESYGLNRWRLNTMTKIGRNWIGGDFQGPLLYTVDWKYPMEGEGTPMVRERVSGNAANNQNEMEVNLVELIFQTGTKQVVPVLFEEQPDPPSITGDAPDGYLGVVYPAFPYVLSSGTPPYTVTERSGGLPANLGPVTSAGVIPGVIPNAIGTGTVELRNTDANGLFGEHTDTVTITAPMMALAEFGGNHETTVGFGTDWSAAWAAGVGMLASGHLLGTDENIIGYQPSSPHRPIATTDFGATWTEGAGDDQQTGGTAKIGGWNPTTDAILLPQGSGTPPGTMGYLRSTDKGANWSHINTNKPANAVTFIEDMWLSVDIGTGGISASTDDGTTFGANVIPTGIGFTTALAVATNNVTARFGGHNIAMTAAAMTRTTNGTSYTLETLPVTTGVTIACIASGVVNEVETWVAATEEGEILYKSGTDAWALATDSMGCRAVNVVFNGTEFYMAGGDQSVGDADAIIKSSANGDDWTTRKTTALTVGDTIYDLACMKPAL